MQKSLFSVGLLVLSSFAAHAAQINGASTGLASPTSTITFDEVVLPGDTPVTNQYASYGVTFTPNLYYSPQSFSATGIDGNNVGNFTFSTEPAFVDPLTLSFSNTETAVAFGAAGDNTPYLVQAFLNGTLVDSFNAEFAASGGYFGFTGESFNSISISQQGDGGGTYYLLDNIEFGPAASSVTPEPSSFALFSTGLLGAAGMLRRRMARS